MKLNMKVFWTFLLLIKFSQSEESYIQINFKRPVNSISDKFISFTIDSKYLLNGYYTQWLNSTENHIVETLGPAYIKLNMNPYLQMHADTTLEQIEEDNYIKQIEFGIQEFHNLNKWALKHSLIAVIQLEYDSTNWRPTDIMRILSVANDIGIKNCVWQLGSEINSTSVEKYLNDLKAFDTMVKVFPKEKTGWKVVSANFKSELDVADVDTVYESVRDILDAVPYQHHFTRVTARYADTFQTKPSTLKYLLKQNIPVWLVLKSALNNWSSFQECGSACIQESLFWAQLLGDSAKSGFTNIFKPLGKRDLVKPDLKYYITQLFKHTVGNKVFGVTGLRSDKYVAHHYAFCSKNYTGGFVLMVINTAENKLKTEFKLASRYKKKSTVLRYTLGLCGTDICLNDEKLNINHRFNPIVRKKNIKRSISLSVPPMSVTFFEFPYVNVMQCKQEEISEEEFESTEVSNTKKKRSPMNHLLKSLALENLDNEKHVFELNFLRSKRHLGAKLKDFNLFKQLNPTRTSNLNNGKILLVNKHQKLHIPGVNDEQTSIEEKIFKSSENNALPRGEMHLSVGPEKFSNNDPGDYDYVEFDEKNSKHSNNKRKTTSTLKVTKVQDDEEYSDPGVREQSVELDEQNFFDAFGGEFVRPAKINRNENANRKELEIGEITAAKSKYESSRKSLSTKTNMDDNVQYAVLVKELQPTLKQNQINMKKAQRKLAEMNLGEEESDLTVIDKTEDAVDYEDYYNEDDERFFNSQEEVEKFKRNSQNKIEDEEDFKNDRLINVVGKLLKKIENRVTEDNKDKRGSAVRTRRSVDSVDVPRRKTKKYTRAVKSKQISKAKPIDIKSIAVRKPNQMSRTKRHIALNENEDWNSNAIDSQFYEASNDFDELTNKWSDFFEKSQGETLLFKEIHQIEPKTNLTINSTKYQVVNRTEQSSIENSRELDIPTVVISQPTEISTVIAETFRPRTVKRNNKTDLEEKVIDNFVLPFLRFWENLINNSVKMWNSMTKEE